MSDILHTLKFLCLCLICCPALSPANSWQSYTSMDNVMDIEYYQGDIWAAAEGGFYRFSLQDQDFQLITRADGLLGNDCYCLEIDSTGKVWSAGSGAYINVYKPADHSFIHIVDLVSAADRINDLLILGQTVFAATDESVFEIFYEPQFSGYFIRGAYIQLGNLQPQVNVNTVFAFDGFLWAGTDSGAARISLDIANKQPAQLWQSYTNLDGLANKTITGFAAVKDTLYAASRFGGIAWFDGNVFHPINTGQETKEIRALNDTLYAATSLGVRQYFDGIWQTIGAGAGICLTVNMTPDGILWAGRENRRDVRGGLSAYVDDEWINYFPNTPGGKYISGLMVDSQARLWCGGGSYAGKGVYVFDGQNWTNFTAQNPLYYLHFYTRPVGNSDGPRQFLEYPNGQVWCGSFGSGIAVFMPNSVQYYYNATDSLSKDGIVRVYGIDLAGPARDYEVIGNMVTDSQGNIWLINRESAAQKPLLMVPADYTIEHSPNIMWQEFLNSQLNVDSGRLDYLVIDQFDCLWMGGNHSAAAGIRYLNFNNTPFDHTDDCVLSLTSAANDLLNNAIFDLALDDENYLWVASSGGVCYFKIEQIYSSASSILFTPVYDLYGKYVNCIAVDPMSNKWFGTDQEGVIVLASDNYTILDVYTAETHPLLDNRILDIAISPSDGIAYIATPQGISALQTPYRTFGENLGRLRMGPIPFYPDAGEPLTFAATSLTNGAIVKIFTINGHLVRKLSFVEASLGWDGKDNQGRIVGSGVYLLLVVTPEGESSLGKVPVIRQ